MLTTIPIQMEKNIKYFYLLTYFISFILLIHNLNYQNNLIANYITFILFTIKNFIYLGVSSIKVL